MKPVKKKPCKCKTELQVVHHMVKVCDWNNKEFRKNLTEFALSRIIRKEREKQKFSRRKLAREIGLSLDGVRRFEQNSREGVRISSIILMADALHLDLVKLMRQALKDSKKTRL